jgi:hypothetical protein
MHIQTQLSSLSLNKCGYFDIFSVKMQSKVVFCPTCQVGLERGQRGREKRYSVLERHYRVLPVCRPAEEVTPATIASLIVDLSDRLPYRAVVRKVNTHTLTLSQLANSLTLCPAFTPPSSLLYRSLRHSLHHPHSLCPTPLSGCFLQNLPMWEKFTARARACTTYQAAAEEAMWLFRQLKPAVLHSTTASFKFFLII